MSALLKRSGEVREIGLGEMVERQNRLASLIATAKRGMADIIKAVTGRAVVFLADTDGYIIHAEGSRAGMYIGLNLYVDSCDKHSLSRIVASRKPQVLSCSKACIFRSADQQVVLAPVYDEDQLTAILGLALPTTEYSSALFQFISYFVDSVSRELAVNRAYVRLAASNNYLTILSELAYSANEGQLSEQAVLKKVTEKLAGIASSKIAMIVVPDEAGQNLVPLALHGTQAHVCIPLEKREYPAVASYLTHKTVVTIVNEASEDVHNHVPIIATPVFTDGKVKGVICAAHESGGLFDRETVAMFEVAAGLVGIILENLSLHELADKEQERLSKVMENVNEAIALFDLKGDITKCNATFAKWFGYLGEKDGNNIENLAINVGVDLRLLHDQVAHDLTSLSVEFSANGKYYKLRMEPSLVGKKLDSIIVIITDDTEAHHFEVVKAEILATISHELRTPITAIQGYIDLIEMMPPDLCGLKQGGLLLSLKNEVKSLADMVEKIVSFNNFQLNQYRLPTESLQLCKIIWTCIDRLRAAARQREVSVEFQTCFPELRVWGDAWGVEEAIFDLLDNAIKFSKAGGQVAVSLDACDTVAVVDVIDSGEGIPREERERIFEQFYRGEEAALSGVPGSGLGLYISRYIAHQHGGDISVEDAETGGTKFIITFPIERNDQNGTGDGC